MARKATRLPKRNKMGRERFSYIGVSPREFMGAMRTGRYQGDKISRRGSTIVEQGGMTFFSLARRKK